MIDVPAGEAAPLPAEWLRSISKQLDHRDSTGRGTATTSHAIDARTRTERCKAGEACLRSAYAQCAASGYRDSAGDFLTQTAIRWFDRNVKVADAPLSAYRSGLVWKSHEFLLGLD
jgi:hypothetical protein